MTDIDWLPNYAGREDIDELLIKELEDAGIEVHKFPELMRDAHPEMRTIIRGYLYSWTFTRNWNYWIAKGPGIPPKYAKVLHASHGKYVRVDGHCGCPSPLEWFKGFAVGNYHVDTFSGLNALADTLRLVMEEAEA